MLQPFSSLPSPEQTAAPPAAIRSRSSRRRLATRLLILYGVYALLMFSIQRMLIFPRHLIPAPPVSAAEMTGIERLWIETPEGPVEGWFLPGRAVSAARPGPAVLFAHGNAELIDFWPNEMYPYRAMGVSVLLAEFRGYGRSAGSPSQAAITEDFVKFHDWLAARPEVDRTRIIFHGRSIGGGAVTGLALQRPPAAMILQSTFSSIRELSRRYLVPAFLVSDPFDNLSVLKSLDCPVLLFHGRHDAIIPYAHAEQLCAAARRAQLITYDCDHNDCPPDWLRFFREIETFLRAQQLLR